MKDLIILVGTNPLPCYLSARYLWDTLNKDEIKNIYFMCSAENPKIGQAGTYEIGERIQNKLKEGFSDIKNKIMLRKVEDVRNKREIACKVKEINAEDIHLNYTGGTKSMAVFFYEECMKNRSNFSSSYLDSHSNRMVRNGDIDNDDDLRKRYKLSLLDIANLHNIVIKYGENNPDYKDVLNIFDEYIENKEIEFFLDEYNKFKKQIDNVAEDSRESSHYEQIIDQLQLSKLKKVWDKLPASLTSFQKKLEFLDGKWFEYWIYNLLVDDKDTEEITYYFDVKRQSNSEFQIDICAVYGYQLTVISVTTSKRKGIIKLKVFEAFHRAIQVGGDEAKIIQLSLLPNNSVINKNETLKDVMIQDIKTDIGSLKSNFLFLGLDDIYEGKEKLRNKIKSYIIS